METNIEESEELEEMPEADDTVEVEKRVAAGYAAATLRRLADALESGKTFQIQINGERISVPPHAAIEFEYEREGDEEELEIEIKWSKS